MAMEDEIMDFEDEEAEEEERKRPKDNRILKLILRIAAIMGGAFILVLLMILIANAVFYAWLPPEIEKKMDAFEESKPKKYISLGELTFKVNTECSRIYFQDVALAFSPNKEEEIRQKIQDKQYQIVETMMDAFIGLSFQQVANVSDRNRIKSDIKRRINDLLDTHQDAQITDIHFLGVNPFVDPNCK